MVSPISERLEERGKRIVRRPFTQVGEKFSKNEKQKHSGDTKTNQEDLSF